MKNHIKCTPSPIPILKQFAAKEAKNNTSHAVMFQSHVAQNAHNNLCAKIFELLEIWGTYKLDLNSGQKTRVLPNVEVASMEMSCQCDTVETLTVIIPSPTVAAFSLF